MIAAAIDQAFPCEVFHETNSGQSRCHYSCTTVARREYLTKYVEVQKPGDFLRKTGVLSASRRSAPSLGLLKSCYGFRPIGCER
jgi:hypothetical protein